MNTDQHTSAPPAMSLISTRRQSSSRKSRPGGSRIPASFDLLCRSTQEWADGACPVSRPSALTRGDRPPDTSHPRAPKNRPTRAPGTRKRYFSSVPVFCRLHAPAKTRSAFGAFDIRVVQLPLQTRGSNSAWTPGRADFETLIVKSRWHAAPKSACGTARFVFASFTLRGVFLLSVITHSNRSNGPSSLLKYSLQHRWAAMRDRHM